MLKYSRNPLIRMLFIRIAKYPDRPVRAGKQFRIVIILHLFTD